MNYMEKIKAYADYLQWAMNKVNSNINKGNMLEAGMYLKELDNYILELNKYIKESEL